MPIGIIVNVSAVLFGGLVGALLGNKIPERLRLNLPLTFGLASMGMGVSMIIKMSALPAVILSLLLGTIVGELVRLEKGIEWLARKVQAPLTKLTGKGHEANKEFMEKFVSIFVLFCASGMGIFGALTAGLILPHTNAAMLGDFSAAGGMIMLATGLRISGIKAFPIANMLPALLVAMPISALWATYMVHH